MINTALTGMEQIKRIELLTSGWRPEVLPLNYTCMALSVGLEPTTYWLTASCSTFKLQEYECYRQDLNLQLPGQRLGFLLLKYDNMDAGSGIEPLSTGNEPVNLPLI